MTENDNIKVIAKYRDISLIYGGVFIVMNTNTKRLYVKGLNKSSSLEAFENIIGEVYHIEVKCR